VLVVPGMLATLAGIFLGLYGKVFFYDEVVHAYNFFALTFLAAAYARGFLLTGGAGACLPPRFRRNHLRVGARRAVGDTRVPL
jgi:hypothetical protein